MYVKQNNIDPDFWRKYFKIETFRIV